VRDGSWPELVTQLRAKLGAPPGAVQVASAAPVVVPVPPSPPPVVARLDPAEVERPGADLPQAIARDVAAVVTPGPVVRDAPPPAPVVPPSPPRPEPAPLVQSPASRRPEPEPFVPASLDPAPVPRRAEPATVVAAATNRAADVAPLTRQAPPMAALVPAPVEPPRPAAPAAVRERRMAAVWIQVGAYKDASTAGRIASQVKGEILVVAAPLPGGQRAEPLLRVRVGPFPDRTQAGARLRDLRRLGYRPFLAED
jgi:hypothetical protein